MVLENKFRKDVRLKITPIERSEYAPPPGINVRFYPYQDDDKQECNATFMASTASANPIEIRDMDDINSELAKLKVLQDNITIKDEPLFVKNFGLGVYGMIDTPVYDGERDHYRSKSEIKEEYVIPVRKDIVEQMNDQIERQAPLLPTSKRRYAFKPQHEVNIDGQKHIMMRLARLV